MRLAEWPRDPYLNEEVREWVQLHLETLGVTDVAVYATVVGRDEDERRVVVATEVGLVDSWYAPQGSSARFGLSMRLYPWQAVHGVDLRGETTRVWAYEHASRWRLRIARPALDLLAETPELGKALAQFAAACAVMAEPAGSAEGGPAPEVAAAREVAPPVDIRQVPAPPPRSEMRLAEPPREAPAAFHQSVPQPAPRPAAPPPSVESYAEPPMLPAPATEPEAEVRAIEPATAAEPTPAPEPAQPVDLPQGPVAQSDEQPPESQAAQDVMARESESDHAVDSVAEPSLAEAAPPGAEERAAPFTSVEPGPEVMQAASTPVAPYAADTPEVAEPQVEAQAPASSEALGPEAALPEPVQPEPARAEAAVVEPAAPEPSAPHPAEQAPISPRTAQPAPQPVASAPEPSVNYEEQYPGEEVLFGINPLPTEPPPPAQSQRPPGSILRPERNGDARASDNGSERHGPFPRQLARPADREQIDAIADDGTGQPAEQRRAPFPGQIFRIGGRQQSGPTSQPGEAAERTPIKVEAESTAEVIQDLERRLGLRPRR